MKNLVHVTTRFIRGHSPAILASGAVVGIIGTAYLSGKASYEAALDIHQEFGPDASNRDKVKFVWKKYIPAGLVCVGTVACVVGSTKISSRRLVAAGLAYSISEQAFSQYKEKVIEQIGENKERAIRDEIVKENVLRNPPSESKELYIPTGKVLCCEMYTMRYFHSDMETLRKAQNDLNSKLLTHDMANLDDFYYLAGLKPTQYSGDIGWQTPRLMELLFTTILSENGTPCLAFEYNYVRPLD